MRFRKISSATSFPAAEKNTIYLKADNWDDYSFVTQFRVLAFSPEGVRRDIGNTKIGFIGQSELTRSQANLPDEFESLDGIYFSLGQDTDFYENIHALGEWGRELIKNLQDLVILPERIPQLTDERVLSSSLLREITLTKIKGQFYRALNGLTKLTPYKFNFYRQSSDHFNELSLGFNVRVDSKPGTNTHAIIGRNGIGKTTILNDMIEAITSPTTSKSKFKDVYGGADTEIDKSYFSRLVSVSFSAFDEFTPPDDQPDPAQGTCYYYIGLKTQSDKKTLKNAAMLQSDCLKSLFNCFENTQKATRWKHAIKKLESDDNFQSMGLIASEEIFNNIKATFDSEIIQREHFEEKTAPLLKGMSSGHAIVLLTITKLVDKVEEKTLVLLDEPECHLHPPLLSAFVRTLSELLLECNGVAIMATHSPVVLQELPLSCVWKVFRNGENIICSRPNIETFGENVGVLTSEVFGLESVRSGFHDLLKVSADAGGSYQEILEEYGYQLGLEGRAILKAMVFNRDRQNTHEENE
ncbi:MAG TPA: AAA family ATPase [Cellvibrionaceae bacterium]|nr:AAA family ATPase [Cellvibrionaceae bacterium]